MEEENMRTQEQESTEDKVLLAVKEEYEKKIAELNEAHKEEIKRIKEEAEERTIKQIKAIMSGREEKIENKETYTYEEDTEESFLERATKETLDILRGGK